MLTYVRDLGFRIGEFSMKPISAQEIADILSTLEKHYGTVTDPSVLVPREDEAEIRHAIKRAAPGVAAVAGKLKNMLESDYSAILIPKTWLSHLDLGPRSFVLFALTLCMGSPTATDRIEKRVVWDVKARGDTMKPGYLPTFSEHSYEAELHTDTQYFQNPERYMLLYFVVPSACGGGRSKIRDVSCVKRQLSLSENGRWALEFLSRQELPFRIPSTFTTTGSHDAVEVTFAKIFDRRPSIRFRADTLERGLEAYPLYDTPEVRKALSILSAELDETSLLYDQYLDADNLLIVNNHEALHGRGEFTDHRRHALRIRIDEERSAA